MKKEFFELDNISKYFSKVIANKNVSFKINKGEVLALLGENGAGKSTIMKILYGLYSASEGRILKEGNEIFINSPKDAMKFGIAMIQQHFSLVETHTVLENIILGSVHGRINYNLEREKISKLAEEYRIEVPLDSKVKDLALGIQQKVEILKALYQNANLLIMDEPTAVLIPEEIENLMEFIKSYTESGKSIVFITHKMKEVMDVADTIIVMRNGMVTGELEKNKTDERELSRLMIGRDLVNISNDNASIGLDKSLEISDLSYYENGVEKLSNISFYVRKGEVLGIAGVSGNGQKELCEIISGTLEPDAGKVQLDSKNLLEMSIRERIDFGLGYVPSNRHHDGMIEDMSLAENMIIKTSYDKKWKNGVFLDWEKVRKYTQDAIEGYQIKASGPLSYAKSLSGGNQQKVVVARETDVGSRFIIFDQPTRGLDLGAINHVHKTILEQKEKGVGILLISTELSEIFALSDRIAIIFQGRIQGIFRKDELDNEKIGLLMAGAYSKEELDEQKI